jgi:hypothetical protein
MARGRPIVAVLFAGVTVAVTVATPFGLPASSQVCSEPYPPVYVQRGYPHNDPPPAIDVTSVTAPPLDLRTNPDFDGDGTPDHTHSVNEPAQATVTRPAGDITFARPGERVDVALAGNLGGSSGQEIWVVVFDSTGARVASDAYVVPYETPGGTYDPSDVGIRMPPGVPWPIPDWTGDGVADVLDIDSTTGNLVTGTTRLHSGAGVMAVGAPGDARSVPPAATIAGGAQALANFAAERPTIVTVDAGVPPAPIVVHVFDGLTTTAFTTGPAPLVNGGDLRPGGVQALSGPDGRFVTVSGQNRSGGGSYWWSIDDPCAALSTDTPPSPPASAIGTTPRYTG